MGRLPTKHDSRGATKEVTARENSVFLKNTLDLWNWPEVDLDDPLQTRDRIMDYFTRCEADAIKPSWEGVAYALGKDKKQLYEIANGVSGSIPAATGKVIRRAYQAVCKYMADCMMNNKIIPVSGIFLLKNNFGYKDATDIKIDVRRPIQNPTTTAELAEKYMIETTDYSVK